MRDALFRAAQHGKWAPQEESVAQRQSERITRRVYERSALPFPKPPTAPAGRTEGRTILWPYPRGSSDIIDRANCADLFLRTSPQFRVVTEYGLDRDGLAKADPAESIVLFCPFEAVLPRLSVTQENLLAVDGRPVDAVASEMIVGFLMRAGLWPKPTRGAAFTHIPAIDRLRTRLVNGTGLALFKAAQMAHFQHHRDDLSDLATRLPDGRIGWDRAGVLAASEKWFAQGLAVVYRPFASSRGTAVSFLRPDGRRPRRRAVEDVLDAMEAAMADSYGHGDPYPVTLSTFVEPRTLDGLACELRMFVVADPSTAAMRAIPGIVCLTEPPLRERDESGHRDLPLSDPDVLAALGIGANELELLGRAAVRLWGAAVAAERAATAMALPFAFGSVDFLLAEDGRLAPIEMNGANVAAQACVHPLFLDSFGVAMRAALEEAVR